MRLAGYRFKYAHLNVTMTLSLTRARTHYTHAHSHAPSNSLFVRFHGEKNTKIEVRLEYEQYVERQRAREEKQLPSHLLTPSPCIPPTIYLCPTPVFPCGQTFVVHGLALAPGHFVEDFNLFIFRGSEATRLT